jgi:copper chaperone CopZ
VAVSTLPIPSMYADHHVTAVRKALSAVSGVQDVQASAALKEVTIKHTKDVTDKASRCGETSRARTLVLR